MTIQLTKDYILAGHCIFTLKSQKTGKHFTFRVMQDKHVTDRYRVAVLSGSDVYTFIGLIDKSGGYSNRCVTGRLRSPSATAFEYFWRHLTERNHLAPEVEFLESGRCCCCGRTLTHPDSIRKGIGPECEGRFALKTSELF